VEPRSGTRSRACSPIEDADWISGDHRPEGVIVAVGPSVKPFEHPPMLIDLAPTILAALQAPASIEHTGRVLHEVVGSDAEVSRRMDVAPPGVVIPGMPTGDGSSAVSDTEAGEMEEHLRGTRLHRVGRRIGLRRSIPVRVSASFERLQPSRCRARLLRSRARWTPRPGP
jgi:hypothetical protein